MPFTLHGLPVSQGIAIGHVHLISHALLEVNHYHVAPRYLEEESARLDEAVASIAYAGSYADRLFDKSRDLNTATPGPGFNPAARRPYPQLQGIIAALSRGWMKYNSLQTRLERRTLEHAPPRRRRQRVEGRRHPGALGVVRVREELPRAVEAPTRSSCAASGRRSPAEGGIRGRFPCSRTGIPFRQARSRS